MHSYQHNIKTFNSATMHLTHVERALYRCLIEMYYDTEQPLPGDDFEWLSRKVMARSEEEKQALSNVLNEFFELTGDVYTHDFCDEVIEKYHAAQSDKARAGKASAAARKKKAEERKASRKAKNKHDLTDVEQVLDSVPTESQQNPTNQKPETRNHEPYTAKINHQILMGLFNEILGNDLGTIRAVSTTRQKHIRARVKEDPEKRSDPGWWEKYFKVVKQTPFLTGEGPPRTDTGKPWKSNFDWLINENNMLKILEGKYE